jgi:hypothetical protein
MFHRRNSGPAPATGPNHWFGPRECAFSPERSAGLSLLAGVCPEVERSRMLPQPDAAVAGKAKKKAGGIEPRGGREGGQNPIHPAPDYTPANGLATAPMEMFCKKRCPSRHTPPVPSGKPPCLCTKRWAKNASADPRPPARQPSPAAAAPSASNSCRRPKHIISL